MVNQVIYEWPMVIWSFCFCFSHHFGNRLHIPLSSYICTLGLDCMIAVCRAHMIFHFLHVEMSKIIGEVCWVSKFRWNMNGASETNLGNSRKPQKVWVWRKIGQMYCTLPTAEILSGKNARAFLVCGFLMKSFKKHILKILKKIVGAVWKLNAK